MLQVQVDSGAREKDNSRPSLVDLSRNASVISTSSSSSSANAVPFTPRLRPTRTFSSPRSRSRDASSTPTRPPAYLAKDLGLVDGNDSNTDLKLRAQSRSKSRTKSSRASSVGVKVQPIDFEFGETLGEGSYSTVYYAIYPPTGQEYAIKILDKNHLKRNNKLQTAFAEKNTLVRLGAGHPGIVRLHWALQDEWSLFFVLDLAKHGELQSQVSKLGSLSLTCARYYAAQIVDAVAYMHSRGVIHRDLKPENLLLDDNMRIKITDFGTGKLLEDNIDRSGTFVGTAQYVAPELLTSNSTSKASDLWAIGCIIFQMIAGKLPFQAPSEYLMWQKVKVLEYTFPPGFDEVAKDLVEQLLVIDPTKRLGVGEPGTWNDYDALRHHPFFNSINWSTLWFDPAPPMEAGLMKKETTHTDQNLDMALAWEHFLVSSGEIGEDLPWVEENGEFAIENPAQQPYSSYPYGGGGGEIGPLDIVPSPPNTLEDAKERGRPGLLTTDAQSADAASDASIDTGTSNQIMKPINIMARDIADTRDSIISTGSGTSSSDGSPVGRLSSAMGGMAIEADNNRGRDRATTPIQLIAAAHGLPTEAQWNALFAPGESPVFHSPIEVKSRARRLTATLLPLSATQRRQPKIRHLLLTTHRLICLKLKHGRKMIVKSEVLVRSVNGNGGKEEKKDSRPFITDVIAKGQNALIVMTTSKPQYYACSDSSLTDRWISEITRLLKPQSTAEVIPVITNGQQKPNAVRSASDAAADTLITLRT